MACEIKENFDLSRLTTFKIGGMCEKLYLPQTIAEFVEVLEFVENPIIVAGGSNLLISSNGVKTPVVSTSKLRGLTIDGNRVKAECGVFGGLLAKTVAEQGLSGFEFLIAFPGTVGGNLYMNASAHGQFMADCLKSVLVFDKVEKKVVTLQKSEMEFAYKKSVFQEGRYILLEADFELNSSTPELVKERMEKNLAHRKQSQPSMANPNAGCVFKNPEGDSAGRLLDTLGMKGYECENVKVWDTHANFIVNKGGATSLDVLELMLEMYNKVKSEYNIELKPEVIFIGEPNLREEEICKILYQKTQR